MLCAALRDCFVGMGEDSFRGDLEVKILVCGEVALLTSEFLMCYYSRVMDTVRSTFCRNS